MLFFHPISLKRLRLHFWLHMEVLLAKELVTEFILFASQRPNELLLLGLLAEYDYRWALLRIQVMHSVTNISRSSRTLASLYTLVHLSCRDHWWVLMVIQSRLHAILETKLCDGTQVKVALVVGLFAPKQNFIVHLTNAFFAFSY